MTADRSIPTGLPFEDGFAEEPFKFITRAYLVFLQGIFEDFPSGCYRWSRDIEYSEIQITDQSPIPADSIEVRPAIVTMRGPCQFANLTLDNLRNLDRKTGKKTHTDMISGTMTINCLAKFGLEAQRVAWIVMRFIRTYKSAIQKAARLAKIGDQIQMGAETPPQALVTPEIDAELVNVPVFSPFFFQWTEETTPTDETRVAAIEAKLTANLYPPLDDPGAELTKAWERDYKLKRPTIRGVPVEGESVSLDNPIETTVKT